MAIIPSKSPAAEEPTEGDDAVELFDGCVVLVQEAASSAMHRSVMDRNAFKVRLTLSGSISVLLFARGLLTGAPRGIIVLTWYDAPMPAKHTLGSLCVPGALEVLVGGKE